MKLRDTQVPVVAKLVSPANVPLAQPKAQPAKYSRLLPNQVNKGEQLLGPS
jgi:hypothetical protein|tara:strand:+ start:361 stop:513 length:153 start_codon:yes stop_codon:yes gene_type:complete